MIEAALLRQLGWSDDLIKAVTRVAEPLRHAPTSDIAIPTMKVEPLSCTAMYSDVVIANTVGEISVRTPNEKQEST